MTVSEKHREQAWAIYFQRCDEVDRLAAQFEEDEVIDLLTRALAAAEREGMRRAVQIIREGYPRPVAVPYRRDGKPSKHDKCAHHFYMIEDCEECAISAILSQANTHSPDHSSHQVNSPASTSSPEPGTHSPGTERAAPADAAVTAGNDLREPVAAGQGQIIREGDAPRETDRLGGDASRPDAEFPETADEMDRDGRTTAQPNNAVAAGNARKANRDVNRFKARSEPGSVSHAEAGESPAPHSHASRNGEG